MVSKEMWALGANRSVIRDLFEYGLQQAKVVGPENVFDYSLGNPSIPSPSQVNETVVEILRDMDSIRVHGYTSALGDMETRSAIAADLNDRYGAGIRPENLFICCGAAPGLIAIMRALAATPEAEFVAIAPFFPEYRPCQGGGGQPGGGTCRYGAFPGQSKGLGAGHYPHTQAVIVNSPNNPTGTVYTAETIRAVGQLLTRKGEEYGHPIYILADEPYRELVYGGVEVPFIPNLYDNTIVCYSYPSSCPCRASVLAHLRARPGGRQPGAVRRCGGSRPGRWPVCAPSLWQKVIARCAHLRPDLAAYDRNRKAPGEPHGDGLPHGQPRWRLSICLIQAPNGDDLAFSEMAKKKTSFGPRHWL